MSSKIGTTSADLPYGNSIWSPSKQSQSLLKSATSGNIDSLANLSSPFPWLSSPLPLQGTDISHESSFSFSLASPSQYMDLYNTSRISLNQQDHYSDLFTSTFSPSIFSPPDKNTSKLISKVERDNLFHMIKFENSLIGDERTNADDIPTDANSSRPPLKKRTVNPKKMKNKIEETRPRIASADSPFKEESPEVNSTTAYPQPNESSKRNKVLKKNKSYLVTPDLAEKSLPEEFEDFEGEQRPKIKQDKSISLVDDVSYQLLSPASASEAQVCCNCKKSRCLKLYCDCFAILKYCDPTICRCNECSNNSTHEKTRNEAIKITKERNPMAFMAKLNEQEQHVSGCNCKNSHCLKKYCECFTESAFCGNNCKCFSCQNYKGSAELERVRSDPGGATPRAVTSASTPSSAHLMSAGSLSAPIAASASAGNSHKEGRESKESKERDPASAKKRRREAEDEPMGVRASKGFFEATEYISEDIVDAERDGERDGDRRARKPSKGNALTRHTVRKNKSELESPSSDPGGALATMDSPFFAGGLSQSAAALATVTPLDQHTLSLALLQQQQQQQQQAKDRERDRDTPRTRAGALRFTPTSASQCISTSVRGSTHTTQIVSPSVTSFTVTSSSSSASAAASGKSSRKGAASSSSSASVSVSVSASLGASASASGRPPKVDSAKQKKHKVKFCTAPPLPLVTYPFFGESHPATTKLIALKTLDFLSNKDLYTMSQVNSLWNQAVLDQALWE